MKKQKGFSLIELLIVVAIILIIAAIAIPNLIRSKMAANEASAVASLRTINTGEVTYNNTYPGNFATQAQLGPGAATCVTPAAAHACLIDNLLASAVDATTAKSGYYFGITSTDFTKGADYISTATPAGAGTTGTRTFCSDQNLVLFFNPTGAACLPTSGTPL